MHDVFISYSSIELTEADAVRQVLEQNGIRCWMAPRDIPGGSNYTHEIPIAIRNAQVFILMLSQRAQNSHWVLKELDMAVNCGKVILPFMLEDCQLNDEFNFLLTGALRYSAYQKKADALEVLVNRVRALVHPNPLEDQPKDSPVHPEVKVSTLQTEPPTKISKKPNPPVFIDDKVCCPACQSRNLKYLPRASKRLGIEKWTILLIPLFGLLVSFILLIIAAILYFSVGVAAGVLVIGLTIGGIIGNLIGKEWIRRHRIRQHKLVRVFKCKVCNKKFTFSFSTDISE